ncbi:hypothetical protein [Flavihumibacter solisilvae]|uniref:Uncharacterized protein n=1 Tax=Flavihumibacter solisilvae TaxID=1349421 RepID=A0A0C1LHB2_9BACT|nr:hypothetical protein [Flavihumibacter solisilvae]KIC94698.1 hypothetical protein OI18_09410 [Flavihumibacter solisilvae]
MTIQQSSPDSNANRYYNQGVRAAAMEYRLVIQPSGEVCRNWSEESEYARNYYGTKEFRFSRPEIVVARFEAKEEMEELLLKWFRNVICQTASFPVLLNNYGSMPGFPLFVRVQDSTPFRPLMYGLKMLSGVLEDNGCTGIRFFQSMRLPIADHINKSTELEILLDYSGRSFRAEMEVNEVLLIKNDSGVNSDKTVSRLKLLPAENTKLFAV